MRVHHPLVAAALAVFFLTCSIAQAQPFGKRAIVPPRPGTMPAPPNIHMPNPAPMQMPMMPNMQMPNSEPKMMATMPNMHTRNPSPKMMPMMPNKHVSNPSPTTMPTTSRMHVPNQTVLRREVRTLNRARLNALIDRALLQRNLMLSGPLYAPFSSPYMATNPYSAGGNVYVTPGTGSGPAPSAGSGNSMLPYAALSYGTQVPNGSNYGSGNNAGGYSAPEQTPNTTTSTGATEAIDIHDDYFKPGVMVVPAGTTVQWNNEGRHHHTVSSTAGLWDSGDLSPGASYSVTFTEPGVYYYFCAVHPHEMRGLVQVTGSGSNGSPSGSSSGSTSGY